MDSSTSDVSWQRLLYEKEGEIDVLQRKLHIAVSALNKIAGAKGGVVIIDDLGHDIDFPDYDGIIAIDALRKMSKIK